MGRNIIAEIAETDLSDPQKAFDGWTGSESIQRGCGYLGQVKELAVDGESLYGAVDGTSRYFTKVWHERGEFGSVCTCPIGSRCKHSVALILKAKELISKGETIPDSVNGDWKAAIESRWVEVERQIKETERRTVFCRREQQRKQEAEERAAANERRREEKFREDFAAVRDVEVSMKYVGKVGNWKDVAVFLLKNRMYDKSADIARDGIRAGWEAEGCGSDLVLELQIPLAEALSGQGDHVKAAAVLAELFFGEPSVAVFQRTLEESERAGCRAEVEKSIIHALETGRNPNSIATWTFQPMVQEFDWRPVPKPVVYHIPLTNPETPAWPLPWANEGVKLFDSRWGDSTSSCQCDMLFLLKLAVVRGDKAEIARRFDNLMELPNNAGFPLEGSMITLCEGVMDAMKGYRDNIVTQLSRLRKSCYVREVKDGRVYAIRTVKKLGEASDDTFVNWQEAAGLEFPA